MVSFVGHSILNSICSLDIYTVTFILDLQACGQRTGTGPRFLRAREQAAGASPLALRAGHAGGLLDKLWYIHTTDYYSELKRNELIKTCKDMRET